jgi:hypothetical protein
MRGYFLSGFHFDVLSDLASDKKSFFGIQNKFFLPPEKME